ncbi:MAG: hypothetical protein IT375_09840 [Polyangiaceae bacterium]|nr:hypothetical protein [Polyangiaceae bacterium]
MAAIKTRTPAAAVFASLVLAACAQATGVGEEDESAIGAGGGVASPGCRPESGCSSCTGCIAACICATGDKVGCVESCGPPGGPPPPPDPPPPPGGGGSDGQGGGSSGGGSPGGGGWGGSPAGGGGGAGNSGGGGGSGGTVNPGGGGGSGGGSICPYPSGPYGTSVGKVLDPNLSWQGFVDGSTSPSTISVKDYFDCDGKRGIHAVFFSEAAVWCGACQTEASELNAQMAGGWEKKGIEVLMLIIQDKTGAPAQLKHAESWKNTFKAQKWSCAADPSFTFKGPGSNGLPLGVVVDPRTMKVVARDEGYDPNATALVQLAAKNAK